MKSCSQQNLIQFVVLFGIIFSATLFTGCESDNDSTNDIVYGTMTDIDGNTYRTILIGTQEWMANDLRVTRYRNGNSIANVTGDAAWEGLTTGAYCHYENNPANSETYGCLYNWHAVNDGRNIAPEGWHVPTKEEWEILAETLGGLDEAGGKMKEKGTTHWESPNNSATNSSGFTGLPGGHRDGEGEFLNQGYIAYYWSASANGTIFAWGRKLYNTMPMLDTISIFKTYGYSVRCVKDEESL